jgi:hypothetical protein
MRLRYLFSILLTLFITGFIGSFMPTYITPFLDRLDTTSALGFFFWNSILVIAMVYLIISFFRGNDGVKGTALRMIRTPLAFNCFALARLTGVFFGLYWAIYSEFESTFTLMVFTDLFLIVLPYILLSSALVISLSLISRIPTRKTNIPPNIIDENFDTSTIGELSKLHFSTQQELALVLENTSGTCGATIVALSGENGIGKTTLLENYESEWKQGNLNNRITVYESSLETRSVDETLKKIFDSIVYEVQKHFIRSILLDPQKILSTLTERSISPFGFELKISDFLYTPLMPQWEEEISLLFEKTNTELLLTIDEFDRSTQETQVAIIQTLYRLRKIVGLRVIIALTPDDLINQLPSSTETFTSKVFSNVVRLPILSEIRWRNVFETIVKESMSNEGFGANLLILDDTNYESNTELINLHKQLRKLLSVPRDIKSFVRILNYYEKQEYHDLFVDKDLILFAALRASYLPFIDFLSSQRSVIQESFSLQENDTDENNSKNEYVKQALNLNLSYWKKEKISHGKKYESNQYGEIIRDIIETLMSSTQESGKQSVFSATGFGLLIMGDILDGDRVSGDVNEVNNEELSIMENIKAVKKIIIQIEKIEDGDSLLEIVNGNFDKIDNEKFMDTYIIFLRELYISPIKKNFDVIGIAINTFRHFLSKLSIDEDTYKNILTNIYKYDTPEFAVGRISYELLDEKSFLYEKLGANRYSIIPFFNTYLTNRLNNENILNDDYSNPHDFIKLWKKVFELNNENDNPNKLIFPEIQLIGEKYCNDEFTWYNILTSFFKDVYGQRKSANFDFQYSNFSAIWSDGMEWVKLLNMYGVPESFGKTDPLMIELKSEAKELEGLNEIE